MINILLLYILISQTVETFFARLAQTRLVRKTDYYNNLIKLN